MPQLTDPDVVDFVIKLGDGRYEFVDSYRKLIESFKVNGRGYRAHITPSGNIYKPKTKSGENLIHCRHCFNLGAKDTDYEIGYEAGYRAGHEAGFQEGYDKCVYDTDKAFSEAEEEAEEDWENEEDDEDEDYGDEDEDEDYGDEDEDEDYGDENFKNED